MSGSPDIDSILKGDYDGPRIDMCRPFPKRNGFLGFDSNGNRVHSKICMGMCSATKEEVPGTGGGTTWPKDCPVGCAPSDYQICSNVHCFDPADHSDPAEACEALVDYTGDAICGWDSTAGCVGCQAFSDSTECSSQTNCQWNSGSCHAKGPTTCPEECGDDCQGEFPGFEEEEQTVFKRRSCRATEWETVELVHIEHDEIDTEYKDDLLPEGGQVGDNPREDNEISYPENNQNDPEPVTVRVISACDCQ